MIYCVWYPSGGFGHFVNAVLTIHGKDFVRPTNSLTFSKNGNSHSLNLVVPKYLHECWPGGIEFSNDKNYCVLIDNGITNESELFKSKFPDSKIVKICYSDKSWPVVARTMINKAMGSSIDNELSINEWSSDEPWARREKYFLFLRDHQLRHAWKPNNEYVLFVDNLYKSYSECYTMLDSVAPVETFVDLWNEWRAANNEYINPVIVADTVVENVMLNQSIGLTHITDVWTQAVIYYFIWLKFDIEVPHNDFADFFTNTKQIIDLVS